MSSDTVTTITNITAPRRDEMVDRDGLASLRYMAYLEQLSSTVNTVTVQVGDVVVVNTGTYNTTGSVALVATVPSTIILNGTPVNGELVRVTHYSPSGEITVAGNGKTIMGDATAILHIKDTSLGFQFSEGTNEWHVI